MSDINQQPLFQSDRMRWGFCVMIASVVWSFVSCIAEVRQVFNFDWFSASGAIMVSGSILFERLMPGSSLGGGRDIASLPTAGQRIHPFDQWLMKNGGVLSIAVLIFGTLIWAYGSVLI